MVGTRTARRDGGKGIEATGSLAPSLTRWTLAKRATGSLVNGHLLARSHFVVKQTHLSLQHFSLCHIIFPPERFLPTCYTLFTATATIAGVLAAAAPTFVCTCSLLEYTTFSSVDVLTRPDPRSGSNQYLHSAK